MTGWRDTRNFVIITLKTGKKMLFFKVTFQKQYKMIKIITKGWMATNF